MRDRVQKLAKITNIAGDGCTLHVGSGGSCISLNLFRVDKLPASTRITTRTSGRALLFISSKMEPSIIKDVCAEVTCIHTSGLRKVAVVALGQTAAVGEGGVVNVRPTEQGRVSKSHCQVRASAYSDDVFPSVVQGKIGQWSYSSRPIFLDRFFPTTQELESLNNFERERILGTSNYDTVVLLHF